MDVCWSGSGSGARRRLSRRRLCRTSLLLVEGWEVWFVDC